MTNDKYIAIFSGFLLPHLGGVEKYTYSLSNELIKLGYKVILVTSNYDNQDSFEVNRDLVIVRLESSAIFKNRYPLIKFNKKNIKLMHKLQDYNIIRIIVNTRFYLTSHMGVQY